MAIAVACAGTPTQTYPGPPLSEAEVAILEDGPDAAVLVIDDTETWGSSWALLPGPHRFLVRFRLYTTAPNVNWTIWSYCWVELTALAGEQYATRVRVEKELAPGLSERVKMEIGIADGQGVLRGLPWSCQPRRPQLK